MRILGIDPGIRGGLAVVETGSIPSVIACIDIPVAGTGAKERVDVHAIRVFIEAHAPDCAVIERAQAMPGQGSSSGFKYGRAVGALEGAIALCGLPIEIVNAAAWKRAFHLGGDNKEQARQLALQRFPSAHPFLKRKKDHGRAEACLLALFGLHIFAA